MLSSACSRFIQESPEAQRCDFNYIDVQVLSYQRFSMGQSIPGRLAAQSGESAEEIERSGALFGARIGGVAR
jgi:hypothetical protein